MKKIALCYLGQTARTQAGWPFRFPTAWSNWKVAYGCYRLQMTKEDMPSPHVWGWGGGTTLVELDLAQRLGCRAAMTASNKDRLREIMDLGIDAIDRSLFRSLTYDKRLFQSVPGYRERYEEAEKVFLKIVEERTEGGGVAIFLDYIGAPVLRATLKALARQGVIATAGWKRGMDLSINRAAACLRRNIHVNTHYARASEVSEALHYSLEFNWMPPLPRKIYSWEEIPKLAQDAVSGEVSGHFAIYEVNPNP